MTDNKQKHNHTNDLKDDRWKAKRNRVVAKANHKCSRCGFEGTLDVHHLYYVKGKHLWEYPYKALVALCRGCHSKWHIEHRLEYREEVWSENKEYKAPTKQKVYFITKGRKSVKKYVPYKKEKKVSMPTPRKTPLQKAKAKILKRVAKGTMIPTFSPIPEWRKKQKESQVQ